MGKIQILVDVLEKKDLENIDSQRNSFLKGLKLMKKVAGYGVDQNINKVMGALDILGKLNYLVRLHGLFLTEKYLKG